MSYMITTCERCGVTYDFGVVGTTFIGSGHVCTGSKNLSCPPQHPWAPKKPNPKPF